MKKFLLFLLAPVVSILLILPLFLVQLGAATQITRSGLTLSDLAIPVWSIKRFIGSIFIPSNFISDPETEVWLYPGIMLIVVSLLGFIRLPKVWKAILGGLTLIVLIVTLGSRTPVFEFLVKFVPFFSYFRVVTRDWLIFVVVVSLLAGWGIQKIERFKYPLIFLILVDLTVFSAIRVWFVPKVNQPFSNADLSKLLTVDHQYRYYCTRRCLSAEETIPKNILSADGYHLVILKEYQDVVSRAGGFSPQPYNGNIPDYQVADAQPVAKYLGEMAVKWVISDHYLSDSAFLRVGSQKGYYLYENLDAYPRVRFEDPLDQTVEVLKDTPDVITIETQGQGGKLILADSYYPGWEASINGQVAQIELYNGWARAVEVPPGRVLVEFSFKPFNHLFNL